ncbi:MAG: hypothetical protein WBZ29_04955 [Methanocella sp.]
MSRCLGIMFVALTVFALLLIVVMPDAAKAAQGPAGDTDLAGPTCDRAATGSAPTYQWVAGWGKQGNGTGQFADLRGLAVSPSGDVFVADAGNYRIQKFDRNGTFIASWGSRGSGNGSFEYPWDVAVDPSGNVYVVDNDLRNVQKFDPNGRFLTVWYGAHEGNGSFYRPHGIGADTAGRIYLADAAGNRIQVFGPDGAFQKTLHGNESMMEPWDMAADRSGNIYVVGMEYTGAIIIQKISPAGDVIDSWATGGNYLNPHYIDLDRSGNVFYSDNRHGHIKMFDPNGALLTSWGENRSGNGSLWGPMGIGVGPSGEVFVADLGNNRIEKFAPRPC